MKPPPPPITTPCSDEHLRRMRDAIFPAHGPNQIQSDESWQWVKAKWRADEAWLTEEYGKIMRRKP